MRIAECGLQKTRRQKAESRRQRAGSCCLLHCADCILVFGSPQSEMSRRQEAAGRKQKAEGRGNGDKGKEVFADLLGLRPSVPWSLEHWERGWTGLPVDLPAVTDPDQVDDLLL